MIDDKNNDLDVRSDFPIIAHNDIAYLDSAASSQKPTIVIEGMKRFYESSYANVHRGIYTLSDKATDAYEDARRKVARFINAAPEEVVFTRGTTDGINMIARSIVATMQRGDEILVSEMEHHSNFVPWQTLSRERGIAFNSIKITPDDLIDMDDLRRKITSRTKVVAVTHVSNVLGTINSIAEIARIVREQAPGAIFVVDGAQAVAHLRVDVVALDADIYVFSGHKMYGPEGVGVLYGKRALLERLEPSSWGGEMVTDVTMEKSTWNELPYKFEPGTPSITQAVGLGIAIDYINGIGMARVRAHEERILSYALERLRSVSGIHILGPCDISLRSGAISFVLDGIHPHDLAQVLSDNGVAVRAGHHCAHPLHCAKGLTASTRASVGVYTTKEDIDRLMNGIAKATELFR
jgi:cysteine desulfurase/selenocysteine lyase